MNGLFVPEFVNEIIDDVDAITVGLAFKAAMDYINNGVCKIDSDSPQGILYATLLAVGGVDYRGADDE